MIKESILILSLLFFSCGQNKNEKNIETSLSDTLEKSDTLINQYAETFRIIKHSNYTDIEVLDAESKSVEFRYSIGHSEDHKIVGINQEVNRVVALSSTHIGMMEKLGLIDKIIGVSDAKYLCSSELKERVKEGLVKSVGDIGMSDIEGYIEVNPDLIIYSGFDTKAPVLQKLTSAGIKTFTNYDWKETHPLGRAEWLKVFGVIFNKQLQAEKLFTQIEEEYLDLVDKVKAFSSEEDILVGTLYGDIFNAPAGDSYMAKILKDANLDYVYQETEGTGSISLTLEEVISDNRNTNIWLNVAAQSKAKVLEMNNRFKMMGSYKNDRIHSYFHQVNCFWEQSAISPHLLLLDICKIAYPEHFEEEEFTFYKRLD